MKKLVDPAHRVVDRLGRPGAAHPDRDGGHGSGAAIACISSTADIADILPAARARGLAADGLPIAAKKPRGLARDAALARANVRDVRRGQHAQLDRRVAGRAGGRDASADAAGRAHAPRVDAGQQLVDDALAVPARDARSIVVTGEALKTQLVRDNGFDPARITSVRTGIDLARFRPLDRAAGARAAAASTRVRRWRSSPRCATGRGTTTSSTRGSRASACRDGSCSSSATVRGARISRAASPRSELRGDVRFAGNQDDVPAWFACADIATLPSYGDEGVPQSLMQAAACGLPAVSTPIGAIARSGASTARPGCSCRRAT